MHGHISWVRVSVLLLLTLALPIRAQQDDTAKKAIEEFVAKMKDSKTIQEKALAIQMFGELQPKDKSMVAPVARYLAPGPTDINYILPVMAAEALSKYRGMANASQAMMGVLPAYKKIPYVYNKILLAIGKVGHESAFVLFDEALRGKDANAAVAAIESISEMPPGIAIDKLFSEAERVMKAMEKVSAEAKPFYDKLLPEILKAIKKVCGQPYPTLAELQLWYKKRGQAWREEATAKEKEKASKPTEGFKPGIPPPLLVEFLFKENGGDSPANSGTSCGYFPTGSITKGKPGWSTAVPTNGGPSSLDWGAAPTPGAVDMGGGPGVEHLKGLKSFTITGWVNCKTDKEAPGDKLVPAGNRLVSWLNHGKDGVELVHRANGSLQIGINQWADASVATSDPAQVPIVEVNPKDAAAADRANWRFFAVTYNSGTNAGHVKFYFGTMNADPKLNRAVDCDRGSVGPKIGPTLTIGNLNTVSRPMAPERCSFRGVIDEFKIFGSTLDGSGALELPELIKVQNRTAPTP